MDTSQTLIKLMLYAMLPLWSIAGFADWLCHRATRIEDTSGLKESLMHSIMGIQIGIPIVLCLLFEVNVMILLVAIVAWILHELVAHWDVHYSSDLREISIWETHVHNYLATLPLFMLLCLIAINWSDFLNLITLQWQHEFYLKPAVNRPGGSQYFPLYVLGVLLLGVAPYVEENLRCLAALHKRGRQP